jgi:hypothetical protein
VRAYVRRSRDTIDENKRSLDLVTSSLEFDPSPAESLAFIREEYLELVPDNSATNEEPRSGDSYFGMFGWT